MFGLLLWAVWTAHGVTPAAPEPAVLTQITDEGVRLVPDRQVPPDAAQAQKLLLEFGETSLFDLSLFFVDVMRKNFLLTGDTAKSMKSKTVMLIGHESMTMDEAWEAYLSALRSHDFTTSVAGEVVTIVPSAEASSRSEGVRTGEPVGSGERIITQLLPVTNADVGDLIAVVKPLLSEEAEVMAYAPANTLIVTDTASNVQKIHDLVSELAIAAPASTLKITRLEHAQAAEVRAVLEALYPVADKPETPPRRKTSSKSRTPQPVQTAGTEASHISKVLDDERLNMLIVLANPVGHQAVSDIVAELDVTPTPPDPSSTSCGSPTRWPKRWPPCCPRCSRLRPRPRSPPRLRRIGVRSPMWKKRWTPGPASPPTPPPTPWPSWQTRTNSRRFRS